jgi:hypothetical protein
VAGVPAKVVREHTEAGWQPTRNLDLRLHPPWAHIGGYGGSPPRRTTMSQLRALVGSRRA